MEDDLQSFVQARYLHLRRTAYLLCGDWDRAEDLVQTALARVVVAAGRRCVDNLDAYARTTLTRVYLDDQHRSPWRRERPLAAYDDPTAAPGVDSATSMTMLAALRALPPRQRAAVVLRYWEDRSVDETAQMLGVSPGTVKSQCAKALATLRRSLAGLAPETTLSSGGTR